jgi:predicted HD superfamily hydrolase involved in NAD metabolism
MSERATTDTPNALRALERLPQLASLRGRMSPDRWRHSLSVAETAYRLAEALGWPSAERDLAVITGLLHDVAKELPPGELRALSHQNGEAETKDEAFVGLLHATIGARLARTQFGIDDARVLRAIADHPTGSPHDEPLAQLLFAADYLEPTRPQMQPEDRALLEEALAGEIELRTLFCRVLRKKLDRVLDQDLPLHTRSLAAWNALCARPRR